MNPSMGINPPFSFPERTPKLDMVRAVNSETLEMGIGVRHPEIKTDSPPTDRKRTPKSDLEGDVNSETLEMGVEDKHLEMKRDTMPTDQDVSLQAQGGKRRRLALAGSPRTSSPLQQQPQDYRKLYWDLVDETRRSQRSFDVEFQDTLRELSESALEQFNQEKIAPLDLVEVGHGSSFFYANHAFYHINFKARRWNSAVAEPSVKLFFAEVLCAHPKPPTITYCRGIEPTDKVTEGCRFCYRGTSVIHPISDVIKLDRIFDPGKQIKFGMYKDIASCLVGIPPWQLNHPGVVQAYNNCHLGHYLSDEGLTGELSLEEYQDFRNTRAQQLSAAVLEDLKSKKGIDLKLVEGLEFSTFEFRQRRFHHLNFGAKAQGRHNELSSGLYFAELLNDGGAYRVTFCCIVDPEDEVLTRCGFCATSPVIQPDVNSMEDLEPGKTGNVLYVDKELSQDLEDRSYSISGCPFGALPCMFPSMNDTPIT